MSFLWDLRHGVLPIIATEMKSTETKSKVQDELARSWARCAALDEPVALSESAAAEPLLVTT